VVLYEVLTGRLPFTGDSEWEVLRKHETAKVEFPAGIGARERAVIERCLAKDPAQRFASVHELLAALGVPIAVSAAAMHERAPDAGSPPPRPSTPPPPPPPGDAKTDPYSGFRRAARDAYTHAGRIARDAMGQADAAMRQALAKSRGKHVRWLRVWLRGQRAWWRRHRGFVFPHRRAPQPAAPAAAPARRPRRLWLGVAAVMLAFVTLNALYGVRLDGPPVGQEAQIVRTYNVPATLSPFVTRKEPKWVALVRRDRQAAQKALDSSSPPMRRSTPRRARIRTSRSSTWARSTRNSTPRATSR
jgi:hypothetical protein